MTSLTSSIILIVDDEAKGRRLLNNLLTAEGYTILEAENGAQALAAATQYRPDIILLDVMMPDLDGYEVCRRLRADPTTNQIPILLLTALDDRESRLQGLDAGADDFISKPFDSVELRTRLRTITRLNRFRQLFDERARFETAINHSPDGIVLADHDGSITLANETFRALVAPPAPIANFFDHLPAAFATDLRLQLSTLDENLPRLGPLETTLRHPRQPDLTVEIIVGRLPWKQDTLLEFIVRDITEKKTLETQLLRSQRVELLGQLASGIVHDVNNLLCVISGHASLIPEALPDEIATFAQTIETSSARGAALLRQILMFARGEDLAMEPTSTAQVIIETARLVTDLLGRTITVTTDTPPDVPDISADSNQLHQVLMNFCVNARDAMPDGGKLHLATTRIHVTALEARRLCSDGRPGDFVTLSVRDSGTGMPPEVKTRLFDPFFTTKAADKGTGLGLATVQRIVRRHEGFISVDTAPGAGTCFTCYFPIRSEP